MENATQTEYDSVNHYKWVNALGDWRDANGVAQGSAAFASLFVTDTDVARYIEIDVTQYVRTYGANFRINQEGGTNFIFSSREASSNRPALVLTRSNGGTVLPAVADVSMDSSTYASMGSASGLATQHGFLIRFNQGPDSTIQKALLRLYATAPQYESQTLKVFRPDPGLKGGTLPSPSPSPVPSPKPSPTPTPSPSSSAAPVAGVNFNAPVVRTWTESGNRVYYNADLRLSWETNFETGVVGDWRDANDVPQGSTPFSYKDVIDTDSRQVIQIDVTSLVKKYGADIRINKSGGRKFTFSSREAANFADRPVLIVDRSGVKTQLQAEADMSLDGSTDASPGAWDTFSTKYAFLIRFPQKADSTITSATLQLVATAAEQYDNQRLLVFRPDPHPVLVNPPALSLGTSADIVMKLEGSALYNSMSEEDRLKRVTTLRPDNLIEGSIAAGALPVDMVGEVMNSMWKIPVAARSTEMFMRTILKLNANFDPSMGGKVPGMTNTGQVDGRAEQCGWGSRTSTGSCWSARTRFVVSASTELFGKDYLNYGAYAYRLNALGFNGEGPMFNHPIKRDEFYVYDERVKLNSVNADGTPNADGELTYWLNGVPVLHWTGVIWRNNIGADTLPSEVWGDIYIGGVGYVAPHPHSYTLHSFTISKKLLPFDANILKTLNGR